MGIIDPWFGMRGWGYVGGRRSDADTELEDPCKAATRRCADSTEGDTLAADASTKAGNPERGASLASESSDELDHSDRDRCR